MMSLRRLGALLALAVLAACSPVNPYYNPNLPHHTQHGFRNPHPNGLQPGFLDTVRWQLERLGRNEPAEQQPGVSLEPVKADVAFLRQAFDGVRMTWVGHSTLLVQMGGFNLLTDPMFSERASPLSFVGPKRLQPPGVALADLPHIDAVVISHNHYDHLDLPTVRALAKQAGGPPVFMVPLGIDLWIHKNVSDAPAPLDVRPLDWWGQTTIGTFTFTLAPVQHWSRRELFDRDATLWGAWAIRSAAPAFNFLFGGDFGYSQDLAEIGRRLGPFDLAALPIGAYQPRWFMRYSHENPAEAGEVKGELRAATAVGIHWGTFRLADDPPGEPPLELERALKYAGQDDGSFFVMKHGETRVWQSGRWVLR